MAGVSFEYQMADNAYMRNGTAIIVTAAWTNSSTEPFPRWSA